MQSTARCLWQLPFRRHYAFGAHPLRVGALQLMPSKPPMSCSAKSAVLQIERGPRLTPGGCSAPERVLLYPSSRHQHRRGRCGCERGRGYSGFSGQHSSITLDASDENLSRLDTLWRRPGVQLLQIVFRQKRYWPVFQNHGIRRGSRPWGIRIRWNPID